jgi:adenylosuccinate lyase
MEPLLALSVLDGRYESQTAELRDIFSEFGLIKHRVRVELQWLKFILADLALAPLSESDREQIDSIMAAFTIESARQVKAIEGRTNHDVKAVEYFIKDRLDEKGLGRIKEWVHFGCTSEDINNTAYALMLQQGREVLLQWLEAVLLKIETLARAHRAVPMLSRTHGQPASPTTVGKEFINVAWRLKTETAAFRALPMQAKINGATGNYNAHHFVYPAVDWIRAGERFLRQYLSLEPLLFSTQINPNHYISTGMHALTRIAATLIDLDRDMWGYISLGYFTQKLKDGEVGSSTMPHKVNPIDFENSEGNLGVAISLLEHLAVKLLQSRFQRDLTDSTVLRNLGGVYGYLLIGFKNTLKGLNKIEIHQPALAADLEANRELLAEPIQTAMRVYGESEPYEKLKALTRGRRIDQDTLDQFIDRLEQVPPAVKADLKQLRPHTYTGLAAQLVDAYFDGSDGR